MVDRTELLARVLEELEAIYFLLQSGQFDVVHQEWVAALETTGREVRVQEAESAFTGHAVRVDWDGALVVRQPDGSERRVLAGDVSLR